MIPQMIYYESMAVQWVSEGLTHFFSDIGYAVIADTVHEVNEALVPLDRLYAARKSNELLVFALQFKAPFRRKDVLGWKLDPDQHNRICQDYFSQFIWYCFPYMKEMSSWHNALFHSHFVCPAICQHHVSWFIWDDYFLYFYPGGGGCHEFIGKLMHLPCGPVPYRVLEQKLRRADRSKWNFTMNYDSWGTLYYKLLKGHIGFAIRSKSDFSDFVKHMKGDNYPSIEGDAIIITVDVANRAISTVDIIAGPKPSEGGDTEEGFPLIDIDEKNNDIDSEQ